MGELSAGARDAEAERLWSMLRRGDGEGGEAAAERFARRRFAHGIEIRDYLLDRYPSLAAGARVLDVGCGDAGISLPFALHPGLRVAALETTPRESIGRVARRVGAPLWPLAATGSTLPFAGGSFDLVLYVETIEHVRSPRTVGSEIARVLRPGGLCYVTTPARIRHLLRPDPHYGIRGLLLLPDALQRRLYERLRPGRRYDVEHLYWTASGVARTLRPLRIVEITSRHPWIRGPARRLDWDWIVLQKGFRA